MRKSKLALRRAPTKRKMPVPKAGPKKRRTKAEMEEARKQQAISDNTKKPKGSKKSGKVRAYQYRVNKPGKSTLPRVRPVAMAKPKPISAFTRRVEKAMEDGMSPLEAVRYAKERVAGKEEVVAYTSVGGVKKATKMKRPVK